MVKLLMLLIKHNKANIIFTIPSDKSYEYNDCTIQYYRTSIGSSESIYYPISSPYLPYLSNDIRLQIHLSNLHPSTNYTFIASCTDALNQIILSSLPLTTV